MTSRLAQFLETVFPTADGDLPAECWVSKVLLKPETVGLNTLSEALEVVERHHQLEALETKLKREHPLDKPHQREYDDRVLDVLTEACAFAWADLRKLGSPKFTNA